MAHELAHVQNRDTLTMTIVATLAGAISMLGNFAFFLGGNRENGNGIMGVVGTILAMIVAPFAAMIVQMAVSRTREYAADKRGAEICGNPLWLSSALGKIARGAKAIPNEEAEHNPATAHMFIINPLSGRGADNLFRPIRTPITALQHLNRWLPKWASALAEWHRVPLPLPKAAVHGVMQAVTAMAVPVIGAVVLNKVEQCER